MQQIVSNSFTGMFLRVGREESKIGRKSPHKMGFTEEGILMHPLDEPELQPFTAVMNWSALCSLYMYLADCNMRCRGKTDWIWSLWGLVIQTVYAEGQTVVWIQFKLMHAGEGKRLCKGLRGEIERYVQGYQERKRILEWFRKPEGERTHDTEYNIGILVCVFSSSGNNWWYKLIQTVLFWLQIDWRLFHIPKLSICFTKT